MNVGEVANRGWDISISATPILTRDFRWDLTANYGVYKNKVVKLADGVPYLEILNSGGSGIKIQAVEGQPMGDIYAQVPQVNENGEYLVSDKGLYLNQTELQKVGNINPAGVGGLFNSFSYKNVFLDFSIDFRIGGDVINEMNQYATAVGLTPESLKYRDTEHGGLSYLSGRQQFQRNSGTSRPFHGCRPQRRDNLPRRHHPSGCSGLHWRKKHTYHSGRLLLQHHL